MVQASLGPFCERCRGCVGAGGAQPGVSEAEERTLSSMDPWGLAELQLGSGHVGPVDAARGKGLSSCMSAREG